MNQEMPIENEFSSEGQNIEAVIRRVEDCVKEGQEQLEMLPKDQLELLRMLEGRELEPLRRQIQGRLGGEKSMEMPEN